MPKIIVTEPGQQPKKFSIPMDRKSVTFGSLSTNDIALKTDGVSSYHCKLVLATYGFEVIDLQSSYGTFYDGIEQEVIAVRKDIRFCIAKVVVDILFNEEEKKILGNTLTIKNPEGITIRDPKHVKIPPLPEKPKPVGNYCKSMPVAKPLTDLKKLPVITGDESLSEQN